MQVCESKRFILPWIWINFDTLYSRMKEKLTVDYLSRKDDSETTRKKIQKKLIRLEQRALKSREAEEKEWKRRVKMHLLEKKHRSAAKSKAKKQELEKQETISTQFAFESQIVKIKEKERGKVRELILILNNW